MSPIGEFLAASNLLPHGHCLFWRPDLLLLHVISDALIALAYFSIPLALVELLRRRRDLVFNQVFLLFAAFITACGLTHVLNVADIWLGLYPISGLMKAFTAFVSLVTAIACWKLLPAAVALPSPEQLREEVARRKEAEAELLKHNSQLEKRVAERTAELTQLNEQLRNEIDERLAAQKRAEFLAAVVNNSDDAIVRVDINGTIQTWNKGAEQLYGYQASEAIGQPISMLVPTDEETPKNIFHKILNDKKAQTQEALRLTKGGNLVHVLLTVSPILDVSNDSVIGFAGISRSIEQRYQAERQLQAYADNLKKANEDLKDFVYIASHDLQEPLRLITSYLNIIGDDYGDKFDEDGRRYINYTLDSSKRLQQLITDLLGYSRLNTTQSPMQKLGIAEIVSEVVDDLKISIDEKQGEIKIDGQLPAITCDTVQLRLVFSNLIGNALKYSREEDRPLIQISATQNDEETCFKVSDNGIGFEQRQAERIFQVFRRLHPRHRYSGTGIGLSICKKIIDRHGGRIWAESEPNVGSQFYFTIPHQIPNSLKSLDDMEISATP